MIDNPLGKSTEYQFNYNPSLLYPIPRELSRTANNLKGDEFTGYDIWNAYELSWLNSKGKPENRILRLIYSSDSEAIVESKSLKLYLNSFIMTKFESEKDVKEVIINDIKKALKPSFIDVKLYSFKDEGFELTEIPEDLLLDNLDVDISTYNTEPALLEVADKKDGVVERYSTLFKSNCPVTGQPDWAVIYIKYKGDKSVDDSSLLKYLISYRNHSGYHESCCELIFRDLQNLINPGLLTVKCFFTRRGGIDINPMRSKGEKLSTDDFHYFRQ